MRGKSLISLTRVSIKGYTALKGDSRDTDPILAAEHLSTTGENPLTHQSRRRGVQLVACRHVSQSSHAQFSQPGQQPLAVPMLPGNAPHVLRRPGIALDRTIAHRLNLRLQVHSTRGQHPHGTKRDGKEPNPASSQLKIAVAKMPASPVSDRPSPFGQAERSIDGNEIGPGLSYLAQDVFIAERDARLRPQSAKKTQTGRTARRTCEVDPKNDKWFAVRRVSTPF